jgi:hypothetical protein
VKPPPSKTNLKVSLLYLEHFRYIELRHSDILRTLVFRPYMHHLKCTHFLYHVRLSIKRKSKMEKNKNCMAFLGFRNGHGQHA